jgi:hypothetical protein
MLARIARSSKLSVLAEMYSFTIFMNSFEYSWGVIDVLENEVAACHCTTVLNMHCLE